MAVKKTAKKKEASAAPTKVEAKETAPKKAPKKAVAKAPVAEPTPAPVETPAPAPTPVPETKPVAKKAAPKKAAAAKKAAPKKVAPAIKLSTTQGELLKKVGGTAEAGYTTDKKVELKSLETLLEKKLIKKGAKDKASGKIKYHISTAGKKHTS